MATGAQVTRTGRPASPSGPGNAAAPIRQVVPGVRPAQPGAPGAGATTGACRNDSRCSGRWPHRPGEIFAVLTDSRGHVAIDSSGMLMQASGDIVTKV